MASRSTRLNPGPLDDEGMTTDRARVRRLFRELQARVVEWDPLGVVAAGAPEDEYDCVTGPLLRMLAEGATEREIESYLNSDFNDNFGVRVQHARQFAQATRAWYNRASTL